MLNWLKGLLTPRGNTEPPPPAEPVAERPVWFGYKCSWIAVPGVTPERVVDALRLTDVRRAGWSQGIELAEEDFVFVAPVVRGWVLATSRFGLAPERGRPAWVAALSARLGAEVQAFVTYRVVEWHGWTLAREGRVVRSYAYAGGTGETLENEGLPTPEERALGFAFFDEQSPESKEPDYYDRDDLRFPDEEDVLAVATRWGFDPRTLDEIEEPSGPGWLGRLPRPG